MFNKIKAFFSKKKKVTNDVVVSITDKPIRKPKPSSTYTTEQVKQDHLMSMYPTLYAMNVIDTVPAHNHSYDSTPSSHSYDSSSYSHSHSYDSGSSFSSDSGSCGSCGCD